tara:strand:- start:659 stop:1249 length:591 start_codon:yes stop_codon:yes gene_type:complete
MMSLDSNYWEQRYKDQTSRWDLGHISRPIKDYIDQLEDKNISILIPGGGNAYEAEYLWKQGFKNVYIADIAPSPLANLKKRVPDFPSEQLLLTDFFTLDQKFDLIIEQTFFCAINPSLRKNYVQQVKKLLRPKGKLAGLLFDAPLYTDHPPFGGNMEEYKKWFAADFKIHTMATAYNSESDRMERELFIIFHPKRG